MFARNGSNIDYVCTGTVKRGDVLVVNDLIAIAAVNGEAGKVIAAYTEGVFRLPKGTGELAQGKKVFWDASTKKVVATGDVALGIVWATAASTDTTVQVKLGIVWATAASTDTTE